jgi:hypothetical protein
VSDVDPLKPYSVALVMIVDPRFPAIVSNWGAWMMSNPDAQRRLVGELLALVEAGSVHP